MAASSTSSNSLVEFRTIQASIIKNLFESIKEILTDVNIIFSPTNIQCTAIDGSKVACVHFKLDADKFEYYHCREEMVIIGINMYSIHKLIKPISSGDTVTMRIFNNERHKLYIIIENGEKHTRTTSVLKLLDIDQEIISIPDVEFDNINTIPCLDFQRHCKDMMTISDKVTFKCYRNIFELSCTGDFADLSIEIRSDNYTENNDISGTFSLKYINLFIKSSSLCSNVEIYLKKNYPLILVYHIGSLGKLQFCLAPSV